MRTLLFITILFLTFNFDVAATPTKKSVVDLQKSVRQILSYRHGGYTKALKALGQTEQVAQILQQIALHHKRTLTRKRAISLLPSYSKTIAKTVYITILKNSTEKPWYRREALHAMSQTFQVESLPFALLNLGDKDKTVRKAALKVISLYPDPRAYQLLQGQIQVETNSYIKQKMQIVAKELNVKLQKKKTPTTQKPAPPKKRP